MQKSALDSLLNFALLEAQLACGRKIFFSRAAPAGKQPA
jgi:hypothetical protein